MGAIVPQVITEDRAGGAQVIDGGLRFSSSRPTVLLRRPSVAGNQKTFTYSCWVKRTLLTGQSGGHTLFAVSGSSSSTQFVFDFMGTSAGNPNALETFTSSSPLQTSTSAVFRDTSAWYHVVLAIDTTQSAASAQAKYYVNGIQQTLGVANAFTQNADTAINGTRMHSIGSLQGGTDSNQSNYDADFYLSQVYLIDGQALDPSYFGYTDPLTNTWRPKKLSSSIAFGTNGFYLPFDGNSPIGQDLSGNNNNWTPVNFGGSNTIEKATGALPILNTDGGGKVARVGVRTDSNASSLVLALPLVGIKSDFSNAINSGTTGKTVTNNGSITFPNTYSNFYGGSAYLQNANTQTLVFGNYGTDFQFPGDYTIECWIYPTTTSATDASPFVLQSGGSYFAFNFDAGTGFNIYNNSGGASWTPSHTNVVYGAWNHFALVRSGSTQQLFVNGVSIGTNTAAGTHGYASADFARIGGGDASGTALNSYIQDFRIYKGLAKYTQNFIPASTDPDILPDTPSGVAYSSNVALVPSTDGAVAFDGTGDYLSIADNADFDFGTGDYTIEAFLYVNVFGGSGGSAMRYYAQSTGGGGGGNGLSLTIDDSGYVRPDTSGNTILTASRPLTAKTWTHVAVSRSSGTFRLFLDGVLDKSASDTSNIASSSNVLIGAEVTSGGYFNGFISNLHVVKGTALYTSNFTPPTAPITSVANTKLLCCKSNSSATAFDVSPGTITANGDAKATNFNPFTVNINTQRGQESGYATWNSLARSTAGNGLTLSNGNLTSSNSGGAADGYCLGTFAASTGKYYWELTSDSTYSGRPLIGVVPTAAGLVEVGSGNANSVAYRNTGVKRINGSDTSYGSSFTQGDVIGVALDLDNGAIYFSKNGVYQAGGVPTSGATKTGAAHTWTGGSVEMVPGVGEYTSTSHTNFGQKPFKFPPPAGFQPLALANTPRPTIVRPDQFVGIVTYTGNSTDNRKITTGFKPDFVWIKSRSNSGAHALFDSIRGTAMLDSQATSKESDFGSPPIGGYLNTFERDGFTLKNGSTNNTYVNESAYTYVAWAWKAGGNSNTFNINDIGYSTASAAGLTAGTITPTGASVNTKSGFSIIKYTGTGSAATVSHGLQNTPQFLIVKRTDTTDRYWMVYHTSTGNTNRLVLNTTDAVNANSLWWNNTSPTSSVFSLGADPGNFSNSTNASGGTYIAYLWAEIPGFSKFGSYTGNGPGTAGSFDGPFVQCGFRPRWILIRSTSNARDWLLYDAVRGQYNPQVEGPLQPNTSGTPYGTAYLNIDILSNGFKIRDGITNLNNSGETHIYCAFAETPSFNLYGGQSNAR